MQGWFHGHGIYYTADGMKYEGLLSHVYNCLGLVMSCSSEDLSLSALDFIVILKCLVVAVVRNSFSYTLSHAY